MHDMNGVELQVGDYIQPIEGRILHIVSEGDCDYGHCLFGQQVEDLLAFSALTQEMLDREWSKIDYREGAN